MPATLRHTAMVSMLLGEAGEDAEGVSGLFRWVAADCALRQRLLKFINLSLGEVGVVFEIQTR
jgi:hypothetical protein